MQLAVIQTGGKQYLVKEKQVLKVEKLEGERGEKISFDKVLLITDDKGEKLELGKPYLEGKKVEAVVFAQGRDRKVNVIKYKAKTRYRRKRGHRQVYTQVKIIKI